MYNCQEAGKSKIETKGVIVSLVNAGMKKSVRKPGGASKNVRNTNVLCCMR